MTRGRQFLGLAIALAMCGAFHAGADEVGLARKITAPEFESPDGVWIRPKPAGPLSRTPGDSVNPEGRFLRLNPQALSRILLRAPIEGGRRQPAGPELALPMPDGTFSNFRVEESPIVAPGRSETTTPIRTYRLWGVDDPTATGRLSWTGSRLHALILSTRSSFFVEPRSREDDAVYLSSDAREGGSPLRCGVGSSQPGAPPNASGRSRESAAAAAALPTFGTALRVYRLAVAATAEYTAVVSGGVADPNTAKEFAYAAIVATVNAANAAYERDLAIRLVLLPKTDILKIIYTDPVTDPYTSGDTGKMIQENEQNLDNVNLIGSANYDIGHVFDSCSGGLSGSVGIACTAGWKGRGVSGGVCEQESFKFQTHYLIHEGAHQLGAPHTFNYVDSFGQYDANNAYEPGSGSTIMSYAGCDFAGCGNEGLQIFPDRYFHTNSIESVNEYVTNGAGTCNSLLVTANQPPVVSAGPDFTIPRHTPFELTATGSDADGDVLQYCWEEYDLGAPNPPNDDSDGQERPILRSFPPTSDPWRIFPSLPYILANANDPPQFYSGIDKFGNPRTYFVGQSLPMIGRTMNFRVTARDAHGGVTTDDMLLHVDGNSGPFAVTSPNTAVVWLAGSTQTVTWDVAGSASSPVSCGNVDILLSVDGGSTFPTVLATNTPNDGSQSVSVPAGASSTNARVKVAAVGNVFFDISDQAFVINQAPTISCPGNISVNTDAGDCAAVVHFATTVSDDQPNVNVLCVPASGSSFSRGTTHVACTATDPYGATDTCGFDVTVNDVEGPTIQGLSAAPSVLVPPNHRMVPITVAVTVTDNCDASVAQSCHITSITSDEPVEGTGDGDTSPDWEITGNLTANLRAERAGSGFGRTYTLTVQCTDSAGNIAYRATTVAVPHFP